MAEVVPEGRRDTSPVNLARPFNFKAGLISGAVAWGTADLVSGRLRNLWSCPSEERVRAEEAVAEPVLIETTV
jgi:hypothetical protein